MVKKFNTFLFCSISFFVLFTGCENVVNPDRSMDGTEAEVSGIDGISVDEVMLLNEAGRNIGLFKFLPNRNNSYNGTNNDDYIFGGNRNDIVFSKGGDDFVSGGDGYDSLYGGDGNDIIIGGYGKSYLVGDYGGDIIYGGPHRDEIWGGVGHDRIESGPGDDIIIPGKGYDMIAFEPYGGYNTMDVEDNDYIYLSCPKDIDVRTNIFIRPIKSQSPFNPWGARIYVVDTENSFDKTDVSIVESSYLMVNRHCSVYDVKIKSKVYYRITVLNLPSKDWIRIYPHLSEFESIWKTFMGGRSSTYSPKTWKKVV